MKAFWITLLVLVLLVVLAGAGLMSYLGMIPRDHIDSRPPALPEFSVPAVLVFNKTNGFIHHDAIPAADTMLSELSEQLGMQVYITDNGAVHNLKDLAKFSLIIWNNVSGDVLSMEQRTALRSWIEQGGGWIGLHAAGGDPEYAWEWYVQTLVRAQFIGHPMFPQFQDADLYAKTAGHRFTKHLPSPWRVSQEEWYAFSENPADKGSEVLLTIDEASYRPKGETWFGMVDSMPGEHPLAWRHHVGAGRVVYSALGHTAQTYSLPTYRQFITAAMQWARADPSE